MRRTASGTASVAMRSRQQRAKCGDRPAAIVGDVRDQREQRAQLGAGPLGFSRQRRRRAGGAGCSGVPVVRLPCVKSRSATFMGRDTLPPAPVLRRLNPDPQCPLAPQVAIAGRLFAPRRLGYRAATLRPSQLTKARVGKIRARTSHEARDTPRVPHRQGHHDRRHRVHHPHDLGQGGRHAAARYRSEVAPGLDRRPAAASRPRRPAVALPEEVLRVPQDGTRPNPERFGC